MQTEKCQAGGIPCRLLCSRLKLPDNSRDPRCRHGNGEQAGKQQGPDHGHPVNRPRGSHGGIASLSDVVPDQKDPGSDEKTDNRDLQTTCQ